jgi:hypothetical protein
MNEWTVVGVLVVLVGLIAAIVKPLLSWNTNLVENTSAIRALTNVMNANEADNKKEHGEIWDKLGDHDDTINKHETRLQLVERQGPGK